MAESEEARTGEEQTKDLHGMLRARALYLFPPEFRQHMIAARREMLLAMRSVIDARLETLERKEQTIAKRATKVSVE